MRCHTWIILAGVYEFRSSVLKMKGFAIDGEAEHASLMPTTDQEGNTSLWAADTFLALNSPSRREVSTSKALGSPTRDCFASKPDWSAGLSCFPEISENVRFYVRSLGEQQQQKTTHATNSAPREHEHMRTPECDSSQHRQSHEANHN